MFCFFPEKNLFEIGTNPESDNPGRCCVYSHAECTFSLCFTQFSFHVGHTYAGSSSGLGEEVYVALTSGRSRNFERGLLMYV